MKRPFHQHNGPTHKSILIITLNSKSISKDYWSSTVYSPELAFHFKHIGNDDEMNVDNENYNKCISCEECGVIPSSDWTNIARWIYLGFYLEFIR